MIQMYRWLWYHDEKRSWSKKRAEAETYRFHLWIFTCRFEDVDLWKGSPAWRMWVTAEKTPLHTCFSSSQAKYQGGGSRREGRQSWRQDRSMKLFSDVWSAGCPPCCRPGPQGLEQDGIRPFSINIVYIHVRLQTNREIRTFLKLPTKPGATQWLCL